MNRGDLSALEIRKLQTVPELEKVRDLEALIWSLNDSVPVNQTVAVVKNGGFILGAYFNEKLVGFQYSFPGYKSGKIYLYSHSLGIHPEFRKCGIGESLKKKQKETAFALGYDLICWTYGPLETVNGNLNLHKLGAVCSTYLENVYGEMDDGMNAGIPTDRFLVEWWIKHEKSNINIELSGYEYQHVIKTTVEGNYLVPGEINMALVNDRLFVPVPGNFQEIKKHNFPLAVAWRNTTRKVFTYFISRGWVVIDVVSDRMIQNQYLYLLEKP